MQNEVRKPDSAGRINIGKEFSNQLFSIEIQSNGDIVLSPVVVRHAREAWLYDNPTALKSVQEGIAQSAKNDTVSLGSFSEFLDEEE